MDIWIVIPTLNRPNELLTLTVASLEKQENKDSFKVLVWDASNNDETMNALKNVSDLDIIYQKAQRKGLALQRNDAISYLINQGADKDDIVVFLDDDVVLSNEAIAGVQETFLDQSVYGVGIPIIGKNKWYRFITTFLKLFFLNWVYLRRHMTSYCYQYKPTIEHNNKVVNWLSGCGMAYRLICFEELSFEEELARFGGYCLGEDALFSYQVYKKYKKMKLSIRGSLQHMKSETSRINFENLVASTIYNRNLIFKAINQDRSRFSRFFIRFLFYWNSFYLHLSLMFKSLRQKSFKDFRKGMKKGRMKI